MTPLLHHCLQPRMIYSKFLRNVVALCVWTHGLWQKHGKLRLGNFLPCKPPQYGLVKHQAPVAPHSALDSLFDPIGIASAWCEHENLVYFAPMSLTEGFRAICVGDSNSSGSAAYHLQKRQCARLRGETVLLRWAHLRLLEITLSCLITFSCEVAGGSDQCALKLRSMCS